MPNASHAMNQLLSEPQLKPQLPKAMQRFNSLVERFDMLTLWTRDTATVGQIWEWYQANDPSLVFEFFRAARDLGYFTPKPNNSRPH